MSRIKSVCTDCYHKDERIGYLESQNHLLDSKIEELMYELNIYESVIDEYFKEEAGQWVKDLESKGLNELYSSGPI